MSFLLIPRLIFKLKFQHEFHDPNPTTFCQAKVQSSINVRFKNCVENERYSNPKNI